MFESLAAYLQDSPELLRTGPGLVRLKVAHVRTELDKVQNLTGPYQSWGILGNPGIQIFVSTGSFFFSSDSQRSKGRPRRRSRGDPLPQQVQRSMHGQEPRRKLEPNELSLHQAVCSGLLQNPQGSVAKMQPERRSSNCLCSRPIGCTTKEHIFNIEKGPVSKV